MHYNSAKAVSYTGALCIPLDEREKRSGRAVTNVGRTCGPTFLLVHLYVNAIKYV